MEHPFKSRGSCHRQSRTSCAYPADIEGDERRQMVIVDSTRLLRCDFATALDVKSNEYCWYDARDLSWIAASP